MLSMHTVSLSSQLAIQGMHPVVRSWGDTAYYDGEYPVKTKLMNAVYTEHKFE